MSFLRARIGKASPIADLVRSQLAFVNGHDATQVAMEGPALRLSASPAEYLGLALHELATNAMKHGALSAPGGKVHVVWQTDQSKGRFLFDWRERNGPPVAEPLRKGFGLVILKTVVPAVFGGTAELRTLPTGACWNLEAPLNNVLAEGPSASNSIIGQNTLGCQMKQKEAFSIAGGMCHVAVDNLPDPVAS